MLDIPFLIESDSSIDVVAWAKKNIALLETQLTTCGAVLLRGFADPTERHFRDVVEICAGRALEYLYRSTPRVDLGGNVYTATEYPSGLRIPFHSENSFQRVWPLLVFFFCELPAQGGGGLTPLADIQKITKRIDPIIRRKFFEKGVMYIRNYNEYIDLPWQVVFQTDSRSEVERFCKDSDIGFEWTGRDGLRTQQRCQAFAKNLRTGKAVWFNQVHLFHPSSLDEKTRRLLLAKFGEESLPRNAVFGDGTPVDEAELAQIRRAFDEEEIHFSWHKGDMLILDNMRVAHARTPYRGNRRVLAAMGQQSSAENTAARLEECLYV